MCAFRAAREARAKPGRRYSDGMREGGAGAATRIVRGTRAGKDKRFSGRNPCLTPHLFPAPRIEIALGGAIVEFERCGIAGPRREGVAQDGDDAGLGQAGKAHVRGCRQRGEKEGRHQGGGKEQARHRQLCETKWQSGPAG